MKKILTFFLIAIFLQSCNKGKEYSIVGSWKRTAVYRKDSTGVYSWQLTPAMWPYVINFSNDGSCGAFSDIPEWFGHYEFDYASGKLELLDPSSGTTITSNVSLLDAEYLIIDNFYNGELSNKGKYKRLNSE